MKTHGQLPSLPKKSAPTPTLWSACCACSLRLLVVETLLPDESAWAEGGAEHFGHYLDVNMLVLTGGRERTPDEFRHLLSGSGWWLARVIPRPSPYSIVEAMAA
jgi:O-methyltransferase domain